MTGLTSRRKGSGWALKVFHWLEGHGHRPVPIQQRTDAEDILVADLPWLSLEAKNRKALALAEWVDQARRQADARGADVAAVVHHRPGRANVDDGYVTLSGRDFAALLRRCT